jgi:hypothetical protein
MYRWITMIRFAMMQLATDVAAASNVWEKECLQRPGMREGLIMIFGSIMVFSFVVSILFLQLVVLTRVFIGSTVEPGHPQSLENRTSASLSIRQRKSTPTEEAIIPPRRPPTFSKSPDTDPEV